MIPVGTPSQYIVQDICASRNEKSPEIDPQALCCIMRIGSGGRIRTCDLRVMSPTSYRTAPPRTGDAHNKDFANNLQAA